MAVIADNLSVPHFDPLEFDALLTAHGVPVKWSKARTCPCMDYRTGQPAIDCPFCDEGILWSEAELITILAPGRQKRVDYDQVGMWMQGMVMLTFPSTATPGHLDRVEFQSAVMTVNAERHVRGLTDKLGRSKERLRMRHALSVENCDAIMGDPVELVAYAPDLDFSIADDGAIAWADGRGPGDGVQYTLRYQARPTFVVWAPQSRDEGGTKQPYRCMAQRLDFFGRPAVGE